MSTRYNSTTDPARQHAQAVVRQYADSPADSPADWAGVADVAAAAIRQALDEITQLHRPVDRMPATIVTRTYYVRVCAECGHDWPCRTARKSYRQDQL